MIYIYPRLSPWDYGFFRIGGPGLANCLFVAARAYLLARKMDCALLRPTWERFGIGQWLRHERDKRLYSGLFKSESFSDTLRRAWLIKTAGQFISEQDALSADSGVVVVSGLGDFFEGLLPYHKDVAEWLLGEIQPSALSSVPPTMGHAVAVHVRLGDYQPPYLTDMSWYVGVVRSLLQQVSHPIDIQLFSDGTDHELAPLLALPGVRRVCYGNALADIIAMSRCGFIIGSDSTFSGWAAFLGQIPGVYSHLHYLSKGVMLGDVRRMAVLGDSTDIPADLIGGLL